MTDKKILNKEKNSEENLEKVVGGRRDETMDDYNRFVKLTGGKYVTIPHDAFTNEMMMNAFKNIGKDLGLDIQAGVYYLDDKNWYYLNDKKVSREELWDAITKTYALLEK